jgi:hypothetical protein
VRFEPGRPDLPVVVFVIGGAVLGRTVQTLKRLRQTAADVAGEVSRLMA